MKRFPLFLFVLVFSILPQVYAGEDREGEEAGLASAQKFYIGIGGIFLHFDTEAAIHSETLGRGTRINLEDDLGFDESQVDVRVEGFYRFGKKHRLGFGYLFSDREGFKTLERTLQIGDDIYGIGTDLESNFRNQVIKVAYHYSFLNKPNLDIGFLAGLSVFDLKLEANAQGAGDISGATGDDPIKEVEEFIFPVPVFGLHLNYRISPKWVLLTNVEYFKISYDDWEGSLVDWKAVLHYRASLHWGIIAGFALVDINYDEDDLDGWTVDYKYGGVLGGVTYSF